MQGLRNRNSTCIRREAVTLCVHQISSEGSFVYWRTLQEQQIISKVGDLRHGIGQSLLLPGHQSRLQNQRPQSIIYPVNLDKRVIIFTIAE